MQLPRISFGIIVLNGEPFTRYCIRQLYPHAHEILVSEGAAENAAPFARTDGHSMDGTFELLHEIKRDEDPEDKIRIITSSSGFWNGRNEQSQAYANHATGDYLWQVDIDEFYRDEDIEKVRTTLAQDPTITGASFRWINFWGDQNTITNGWFLQRGGGDVSRLFKWGPGFTYGKHWEGPTAFAPDGSDMKDGNWIPAAQMQQSIGVCCFHYSFVFPHQVMSKSQMYKGSTDPTYHHDNSDDWAHRVWQRLEDPFHTHNRYEIPAWLEAYRGDQPAQAVVMFEELQNNGRFKTRDMSDVRVLNHSLGYSIRRAVVRIIGKIQNRLGDSLWSHYLHQATEVWLEKGVFGLAYQTFSIATKLVWKRMHAIYGRLSANG